MCYYKHLITFTLYVYNLYDKRRLPKPISVPQVGLTYMKKFI